MVRIHITCERTICNATMVGRNKLIINHLGRLFVTSDAATIIRETEVVHPAAKLLVMASQAQESEVSPFEHVCVDFVDVLIWTFC
jgi:T-complex protein 1 subunit theta